MRCSDEPVCIRMIAAFARAVGPDGMALVYAMVALLGLLIAIAWIAENRK